MDGAGDWGAVDLDALAHEHAPADSGGAVGIVVQDSDGRIVASTPVAEDILGMTSAQMTGRTSIDPRWMTVAEDLRPLEGSRHPAMLALASQQMVRGVVIGVYRPDMDAVGQHVWISVTAVPFRRSADGPQFILSVFSVLTGPRAIELRLAESEAAFHFLARNSSDMVAWQLFDTTFLWVSPASATVLGWSPQDLVGTRSIDLVHPDDVRLVEEGRRAITEGALQTVSVRRMRHADGHYLWVETTARVAESESASATQVQTTSRNVDDRVAAQQAQATAEASRDRAVRLFRTAMEHAAIGMAIRDLDGRIVEVNGALCTMLGLDAALLKGATFRDFTHLDDLHAVGAAHAALLSGQAVSHDSERRYLRPGGGVVWVQATSVLLPLDDNEPQLVLTQMQDITARKDAIEQLTRLAVTDSLTGLANRSALMDRLAVALDAAHRGHQDVGVVFIDLDGFKAVNDTYGHDTGDQLLRQVAGRLSTAIRAGDTAARLGGDEFVILCEQVDDLVQVEEVADRVSAALLEGFVIGEQPLWISASSGMTLGRGSSASEVLGRADEAMYRAKRRGRGLADARS